MSDPTKPSDPTTAAPTTPAAAPPQAAPEADKPEYDRRYHRIQATKVKPGDLMVFPYWGHVVEVVNEGQDLLIEGIDPGLGRFHVRGHNLIEGGTSADQYDHEEKVTKTRAAELVVNSHNKPFTVCFTKQTGEDRVLRGRLIAAEPLLGRSHVEDLDVREGHRIRLVDHRTIKWVIVDGLKYVVR
jgi:hypothetical protein